MQHCPRDTSSHKCATPIIPHCGYRSSAGFVLVLKLNGQRCHCMTYHDFIHMAAMWQRSALCDCSCACICLLDDKVRLNTTQTCMGEVRNCRQIWTYISFAMQMCYTGTFAAYLPRWTVFRRASPIMQIIIDRDRQILYTRSRAGAIMVCALCIILPYQFVD